MTWGTLWQNLFLIPYRIFDSWRQLWCHFALSHWFVYLIVILSDLTWFLRNIYNESNCSTRPEEPFDKILIWYHVAFLTYDVILLYFTNFTTYSPFWATRLEFYEIFIRSKIVERDLSNILKKSFFDTMSRFWPMTSFVDLILLLHRLFEQLNLIFTKYLWGVKLFNMPSSW